MRLFIHISFVFGLIFTSCGSPEKSNEDKILPDSTITYNSPHQDTSLADASPDSFKANFNGDYLKEVFSKFPYNYTFKEEVTIKGTTDSHFSGRESENEYDKNIDLPNTIEINYDKNTRMATSVTFYLSHFRTREIKVKHLKKLFDFINHFDLNATSFIKRNFRTIFYNESAYDELEDYESGDKRFKMGISHSLFSYDYAKANNRIDVSSSNGLYIVVTINFTGQ